MTSKTQSAPGQKESFLRPALAYAQILGWRVFPLKPRTKQPLTKHGFQDATRDEKQIRESWRKWPQANIGVPTGETFWVLDIDPRHGGDEELEMLVSRYGCLPPTIQQVAGGGGRHCLFAPPEGRVIPCITGLRP